MKSLRMTIAATLIALAAIAFPAQAFAAETTITVAQIVGSGVTTAPAAANVDGSKFLCPSDARTFLRVKNASGGSINATIVAQTTSVSAPGAGVLTVPNIVVAVPATTGDKLIGPFGGAYADQSGYCHVTFSAVTSVTTEAYYLGSVR